MAAPQRTNRSGIPVDVKLVAEFRDGKPLYEVVPAMHLGGDRFELTGSPGFATGVASGDEIELTDAERLGYRIVKRGGNVCVQLFLDHCSEAERSEIAAVVEQIGGKLDGGMDGKTAKLLIFTIPITVGFRAIEQAMDDFSKQYAVDRWMYGNVYSTTDGVTPLNWWIE